MAEIAHVANVSECVVMIEASLACPITNSFLILMLLVCVLALNLSLLWVFGLGVNWSVLIVDRISCKWIHFVQVGQLSLTIFRLVKFASFLFTLLFLSFSVMFFRLGNLYSGFFVGWQKHMCRFSIMIFFALDLFAPETLFSSLEVVVLTFTALPSAIWEIKWWFWLFTLLFLFLIIHNGRILWFHWRYKWLSFWRSFWFTWLVQRLDSASHLGDLSKLGSLFNCWSLLDYSV